MKRKCPVCSECRDQLIVIEQFSRKCIQSQVFINLCSKRKLFTDDEVVEFRKEYYRTGGKVRWTTRVLQSHKVNISFPFRS